MDTDDLIQDAISIGQANKEVIELLRNWCSHIEVERSPFGGVGLVEQQTELPIGYRHLRCKHAREPSMGSMRLRGLALAFYDNNCDGCPHRDLVGLPNISEVVQERDEAREEKARTEADANARENAERRGREAFREELRVGAPTETRVVLDALSALDSEGTVETGERLLGTLLAAGSVIGPPLDAIFVLTSAGGSRTEYALKAVHRNGQSPQRILRSACEALGRRQSIFTASTIVAALVSPSTPADEVKAAMCGLVAAAGPERNYFNTDVTRPDGLQAVAKTHAEECTAYLRMSLASDSPWIRAQSLRALHHLKDVSPGSFLEQVPAVCEAITMPDGIRMAEKPSDIAEEVLAIALQIDPDGTDTAIWAALGTGSPKQRTALVGVYEEALLDGRRGGWEATEGDRAKRIVLRRIVQEIAARRYDDAFEVAVRALDTSVGRALLSDDQVESLIGAVVLMGGDLNETCRSPLDIRPQELSELDLFDRQQTIFSGMQRASEAVAAAASRNPSGVLAGVTSVLDTLGAKDVDLKRTLVHCLGGVAKTPAGRRAALPVVYRLMLDADNTKRSAALAIYEALCEEVTEDLPPLLHQTYLVLLGDPFVVVHRRAVRALQRYATLPAAFRKPALESAWAWMLTYAGATDPNDFLADCTEVAVMLAKQVGEWTSSRRRTVVEVLRVMSPSDAHKVLERCWQEILGAEGLPVAVLELLANPKLHVVHRKDLVDAIHHFDGSALRGRHELLRRCAEQTATDGLYPTYVIAEALGRSDEWGVAAEVLSEAAGRLRSDVHDRPAKDALNALASAFVLEAAIAEGNRELVSSTLSTLPTAPNDGQDHSLSGQNRGYRFRPRMDFSTLAIPAASYPRACALRALQAATNWRMNDGVPSSLESAEATLTEFLRRIGLAKTASAYLCFANLFSVARNLVNWARAVRSAEMDSDRFRRAADLRLDEVEAALSEDPVLTRFMGVIERARGCSGPEQVTGVVEALCHVPLPVPLFGARERTPTNPARHSQSPTPAEPTPVAILSFRLNGNEVQPVQAVAPKVLHELRLSVRLSVWPSDCVRLVVEPLTLEPPDVCEPPSFTFSPHQPPGPESSEGRLLLKLPQSFGTQPVQIRYTARFETREGKSIRVVAEGQKTLQIRGFDPSRTPISGYEQVDLKLIEIQDALRTHPGLGMEEVSSFMEVMKALGNGAGQSLQDKIFAACAREADFQNAIRGRFRSNPAIGSKLEEHAHTSGGITDLSFNQIRIELKYEDGGPVYMERAEQFSGQVSQYVAGSDKRLGILCILDNHERDSAPGSVQNDIELKVVPPPQGGQTPLLLGVVIVRGKLPRPSDLSR